MSFNQFQIPPKPIRSLPGHWELSLHLLKEMGFLADFFFVASQMYDLQNNSRKHGNDRKCRLSIAASLVWDMFLVV